MNKNLESLNSFVSDLSNSGVAVYALNRTNEIPRQKIQPLINDCFFKVPGQLVVSAGQDCNQIMYKTYDTRPDISVQYKKLTRPSTSVKKRSKLKGRPESIEKIDKSK